ncbi:MAG: 50S ribosomal protein L4 [Candidatus Omnitrophica bacterium]|nr:50S ribosomal protein L4 [Candidatus Omnitrophota bacterium]
MENNTLPIYSIEGKEVDSIKLNSSVFDGKVNKDAIYQAINCFRANQRKGLASTKTRGEVSGGGKKPWKQKGTGRARVGSTRSPLWRHGGVVFGPHPRDFSYTIPNKIKIVALKSGLNAKVNENNLIVLDSFKMDKPKVKDALKVFTNLKIKGKKSKDKLSILLLLDKLDESLKLSLRNIDFLEFDTAQNANAYDVLRNRKLVITKAALNKIIDRLKT